ncbi:zinc finger protein 260-like [Eurosta solidaginis]|uniref:zinc finger protein 260-like n=1 Tax=Eurosta solidaginis TaxID=178769 RepID=UPI003530AED3
MPSLTRENMKQHCRTCLRRLKVEDVNSSESLGSSYDQIKNSKEICINIEQDEEIKELISTYLDGNWTDGVTRVNIEDYPQCVCIWCYNKLQSYGKFRKEVKQSAQKLQALIRHDVNKIEIGDEDTLEVEAKSTPTSIPDTTDLYKFLAKDDLMEPETVLLGSANASKLANNETTFPDPFDKAISTLFDDNSSDDECQDESIKVDAADTESSEEENLFSLKNKSKLSKRSMRSDNKPLNKPKNVTDKDTTGNSKKEVKKRRRRQKLNTEIVTKIPKRRNRGTKNSLKCDQCGKRFSHKITLDGHIRQVHEGCKRPFKCDRCENSYALLGGLYTHIKEIHEAEVRSYTCSIDGCDLKYTNSKSLERHKRTKHCENPVVKKYVCEQCGATFNQTANLRYHRRTKHPTEDQQAEKAKKDQMKERFECETCKKLFHSRYTLKYHTLQFHTKQMNYECNVCGKKVALKFMLDQHMLVHSTNKIPCDVCGRAFVRKFELDKHIKAVHMKLKPFPCQYCNESFAIRKTLIHHEYTHTGEKPYVCDICGNAYRQQSCLKNHRKSHGILSGVSTSNSEKNSYFTQQSSSNVDCSKTEVMDNVPVTAIGDGGMMKF